MKLNLGCGNDHKNGFINLDQKQLDLNKFPYPYKDNSIDTIILNHVLEHLTNPIKVLTECYRILKPNSTLKIKVPHHSASGSHSMFHTFYFSVPTFYNFEYGKKDFINSCEHFDYYKIKKLQINFNYGLMFWYRIINYFVNINRFTMSIYEQHFCYIFPAKEIEIEFIKIER